MLGEVLTTPDAEVLHYIADKIYQLLVDEFGSKPDSVTWDHYVLDCMLKCMPWFQTRGLEYPEVSMFVDVMDSRLNTHCQAGHGTAPREVGELVRELGEEWERLWMVVCPSD